MLILGLFVSIRLVNILVVGLILLEQKTANFLWIVTGMLLFYMEALRMALAIQGTVILITFCIV